MGSELLDSLVGKGRANDVGERPQGDHLTGQVKGDLRRPLFIGVRAIPKRKAVTRLLSSTPYCTRTPISVLRAPKARLSCL